jgi:hypothetical protein
MKVSDKNSSVLRVSFENTGAEIICVVKMPPGFIIPAKAVIQVNWAQNKPGFPRALE